VTVGLTGSGTQSSSLTTDLGTSVDFTHTSAADNSAASVNLSNVFGDVAVPAKAVVTQTAVANRASADLSVAGGTYTMGALTGVGAPAGIYVYQNSSGATLNATVTAGANGYTAKFIQ
jgi:hypothetical protein